MPKERSEELPPEKQGHTDVTPTSADGHNFLREWSRPRETKDSRPLSSQGEGGNNVLKYRDAYAGKGEGSAVESSWPPPQSSKSGERRLRKQPSRSNLRTFRASQPAQADVSDPRTLHMSRPAQADMSDPRTLHVSRPAQALRKRADVSDLRTLRQSPEKKFTPSSEEGSLSSEYDDNSSLRSIDSVEFNETLNSRN